MIRTVIVDDDSLVHATLRSLVDWESFGYTIVEGFSDGSQALAWLQKNPADLLITDIRMPETSGLELMRRLEESGSLPVTVVLSGYDEFELVREAFRLGAKDYLLKGTLDSGVVTQLLRGLRQRHFPSLAVPDRAGGGEGAPRFREGEEYVVITFGVQHFPQAARRFGDNLREGMEKPMVELTRQIRRLQKRTEFWAQSPSLYRLAYRVQDRGGVRTVVPSMARQIQEVWRDYMNLETAAGISGVFSPGEAPGALARCETLCRLAVLQGPMGMCSQWQDGELALAYETGADSCDPLIAALCGEDGEGLEEETARWLASAAGLEDREQLSRMLVLLARLGERLEGLQMDFFQIFPEQTDFPRLLRSLESWGERQLWLCNTLNRVQSALAQRRREGKKNAMDRAKDFMRANFTNPELTLRTVADYVGFSEKYFSARFTRECGTTFVGYLSDLRLRRAQELLLQTDLRVYEVSEAAGYSSVEHFNHTFKKKFGVSPKSYRQGEK